MLHPILLPVLGHIGLVFALYVWLTLARTAAVNRREIGYSAFEFVGAEPNHIARITRNLANQFELPIILYACVAILIAIAKVETIDTVLCWISLVGRFAHTAVQTLTSDVKLRGRVFTINFLAVVALAGHVALIAVGLI